MIMEILLAENEAERLEALERYQILDTEPEEAFDGLTYLASQVTDMPIALLGLMDRDRQWFKSGVGAKFSEIPREYSFCQHTILHPEQLLVVPDAQHDERFKNSPLVVGEPNVRFYAGAPIFSMDGAVLGTLCRSSGIERGWGRSRSEAHPARRPSWMNQHTARWPAVAYQTAASDRQEQPWRPPC